MEQKSLHYLISDERLREMNDEYLLGVIEVNESHLDNETLREGAEERLKHFIPEAKRRAIGRFSLEIAS